MKGRKKMQEVYDAALAIIALGIASFALSFCIRVGWEIGGKL